MPNTVNADDEEGCGVGFRMVRLLPVSLRQYTRVRVRRSTRWNKAAFFLHAVEMNH